MAPSDSASVNGRYPDASKSTSPGRELGVGRSESPSIPEKEHPPGLLQQKPSISNHETMSKSRERSVAGETIGHSRVRFSEDVGRNAVTLHDVSTQSSQISTQKAGGPSAPRDSELPKTQSRKRDRGYSLRRSLFAQTIQQQNVDQGMVLEMETEPHFHQCNENLTFSNRGKVPKATTIVSVNEDVEMEPTFPYDPVRLSDSAFELPLYTRWLKQQSSKSKIVQRSWNLLLRYRPRLFQTHETPPSPDGRHVKLNLDQSHLPVDQRTQAPHISNIIRSCRYNIWNFFPRQLVAQFGKLANFYFLCVSILQMIPGLSTTGTYTTIIPLLIFVAISMGKEGYDDIRRNRLDKEENERDAKVLDLKLLKTSDSDSTLESPQQFNPRIWRTKKWQEIRVGDVILLQRDSPVPADMVILRSSKSTGIAYVETKSLDGETNLKSKKPLDSVSEKCKTEHAIVQFDANFIVEDPNLDLYKFDGKVMISGETFPLTNDEVLYRGSIIRNTNSVVGLVIFSGEECKIRMNANKNPRIKAPTLQARVNRVVIVVACLVFLIAILMTVAYQIWRRDTERKAWYLIDARVPIGQILVSFVIMFNTMLPLSLYVSLEIVKVAQMFLMNDIDMYDPDSDTNMEARTSTINEELGQVSYIFSDKTGTLTNNSMRFRKMSIAGMTWLHDHDLKEEVELYGTKGKLRHKKRGTNSKGKQSSKIKQMTSRKSGSITLHRDSEMGPARYSSISTSGQVQPNQNASTLCGNTEDLLDYIQNRPLSVFARKARFFILALALCHTCVPEKDDESNITFQASSPDELALVKAAQDLGYIVTNRESNTITVKTFPNGEDSEPIYEVYEVLDVIAFSSARKRMSIIVRFPDSRICIFCKGADTTIRQHLRLSELAESHADDVQRRASIRKSIEIQEIIRRRSSQIPRTSLGASPMYPTVGRNSSVSLRQGHTVRDSIDAWLRDREQGVEVSTPRGGVMLRSARNSTHVGVSSGSGMKSPQVSFDVPRHSFQSEDVDDIVDESIVINDNAVFERCFQHIDDFATEGLRTLLYGHRMLTEDEYQSWKSIYHTATTSLVGRQEKIEQASELIEKQLELTGATAIEDKLQKGVPDAIDRFRRAGIKMWMLTGDKRETAINIGHSCRLIKDYSSVMILDHEVGELPSRMKAAVAQVQSAKTAHSVLVIDGQTLTFVETDPALKALFTDLAIAADSVICCRASPSQKASLVKTIRTKVKGSVTLAIGDGANDIAMIQEAHLGIGIAGKEGLQAARTSDYSIAQFRFLVKLLLVHGRWNYIRVCKYTLGTFWKEMLFYLVQALYQRWTGYTGTSLYEPWSMSMFNTLFTSLPVIFMGVFEKDLSASTLLAIPELYSVGQRNQGFNVLVYVRWAVLGATEAVIVFFIMYSVYGEALFTRDHRLYAMGSLAFTACVTLISLKMQCFELHNKSLTACLAMFLSMGGWWLWNLLLSTLYKTNSPIYNVNGGLLQRFGKNPLWWLTLLLIILAISTLEIFLRAVKCCFFPSDTEIFQVYERDIEIKKRFEESAADLLQQGWDRSTKKSSLEMARDEVIQAQREAEVQEILDRPRTMEGPPTVLGMRKRQSWQPDIDGYVTPSQHGDGSARRSLDVGELFSKGYGLVKKGTMR